MERTKLIHIGNFCMIAFAFLLVFSVSAISAETPQSSDSGWVQIFFETENDSVSGNSVQQTSDGGYVITGSYHSYPEVFSDEDDFEDQVVNGACLIKTHSNGTLQWFRVFDASYNVLPNVAHSVQQTSDGGYIIAGSYEAGNRDLWLIKTDAEGRNEWDKTYGGSSKETGFAVKETFDGGYIVTGYSSYGQNIWLLKTDSNGNEEWDKIFGNSKYACGRDVLQVSDGGYVVTGDSWLIKTDPQGNEEWNRTDLGGRSICQTTDGGYIIVGEIGYRIHLIKTDHTGNTEWSKTFEEFGTGDANGVQQTIDGGYIITGSYHAT